MIWYEIFYWGYILSAFLAFVGYADRVLSEKYLTGGTIFAIIIGSLFPLWNTLVALVYLSTTLDKLVILDDRK